jgi:hypothetical protein
MASEKADDQTPKTAEAQLQKNPEVPTWPHLLGPLMLLVGLLLQAFLLRPGSSSLVLLSTMILYFVISLSAVLLRRWSEDVVSPKVATLLALLASIIAVSCFIIRFGSHKKKEWYYFVQMLPGHPFQELLALAVLILLCLFLGRVFYFVLHHVTGDDPHKKWLWWALTVPLFAFGLYDAVIGFAAVVYPYIPVEKGGGDYENVSTAVFYGSQNKPLFPADVQVVVLLETDDCYYVAKDPAVHPGDDPPHKERRSWGKLGYSALDKIYQIPRNDLTHVDYKPPMSARDESLTQSTPGQ